MLNPWSLPICKNLDFLWSYISSLLKLSKFFRFFIIENFISAAADIKFSIIKNLKNFESFSKDEIYDHRKSKFLQIGRDQGFSKSSNITDGGLSYKESVFNKLKSQINKNKYVYAGFGVIVIIGLLALLS